MPLMISSPLHSCSARLLSRMSSTAMIRIILLGPRPASQDRPAFELQGRLSPHLQAKAVIGFCAVSFACKSGVQILGSILEEIEVPVLSRKAPLRNSRPLVRPGSEPALNNYAHID